MFMHLIVVNYNERNIFSHSLYFLHHYGKYGKSNLIILPKVCNVMDYVTDYIFGHVIWTQ